MIFKKYFKSKKIKKLIFQMPSLLISRYGLRDSYTYMQVLRTVEEYKLNQGYMDYLIALFLSDEEAFNHINASKIEDIRNEVSRDFLNGNHISILLKKGNRHIGNSGHDSLSSSGGSDS